MPSIERLDKEPDHLHPEYTEHPWPDAVLGEHDQMSFLENTGTRPNLAVSPGRPQVLGPDCAPSTLSRGVYPGLIGMPPTYCCNTSHRHPPPPTLTRAAHAGACSGHPAVPSTGSETRGTNSLSR
ncbi:hypothetical protein TIFTF001_043453 [Ficus carica]|uniref:Uncharacterized protein n=1 Tax=Ficus carica TaxID=3494 RepID=A0AA87YSS9_FICCA|nr:hypothetical protein TIFTF001_043453 [Ficus carica]